MTKFGAAVSLAALLLFACSSPPLTAEWVSGQTQSSYDRFQKVSWIVGPYVPYEDRQGYKGRLYLCAVSRDSGGTELLLGVENTSNSPELFTAAASMTGDTLAAEQSGVALPPQPLDPRDTATEFTQKVRVTLTKDLLLRSQSNGLTIRLYGQRANLDLTIPAAYIQGFLRKA